MTDCPRKLPAPSASVHSYIARGLLFFCLTVLCFPHAAAARTPSSFSRSVAIAFGGELTMSVAARVSEAMAREGAMDEAALWLSSLPAVQLAQTQYNATAPGLLADARPLAWVLFTPEHTAQESIGTVPDLAMRTTARALLRPGPGRPVQAATGASPPAAPAGELHETPAGTISALRDVRLLWLHRLVLDYEQQLLTRFMALVGTMPTTPPPPTELSRTLSPRFLEIANALHALTRYRETLSTQYLTTSYELAPQSRTAGNEATALLSSSQRSAGAPSQENTAPKSMATGTTPSLPDSENASRPPTALPPNSQRPVPFAAGGAPFSRSLSGSWRTPQLVVQAMENALELDPANALLWQAKGSAALQAGNTRDAINALSQSIRLMPDFALALYDRGTAYVRLHLTDLALEDYTAAMRVWPRTAELHRAQGTVFLLREDMPQMCSEYRTACELGECDTFHWAVSRGHCLP